MKQDTREYRAKMNICVTLLGQFVTAGCGLIVPRLLLSTYGSELYGATTSITQFLGYIMLLEGGIGGVAKAALYKPLAENNMIQMSKVMSEVKKYFRVIAYVFLAYVLVLAVCFKSISHIEILNWAASFALVITISISSFAEYFLGISNAVFLQANQKIYIVNAMTYITTALSAVVVFLFAKSGASLIIVKLASSCVYVIKPVFLQVYVKKNYQLQNIQDHASFLKDKWAGLGHQLANFLHSNTDIILLTIFSGLKYVAVYSVYNMVVVQIQKISSAFSSGMEALFGDMYARNEIQQLNRTFNVYETMLSITSVTLFSVTAVMITPFVTIYSKGINDVNYTIPLFGLLLSLAALITALSTPYSAVAIAAGHFKQTQLGAYGEAAINIIVSLMLVSRWNLIGVAIGTVVATLFRFIFYSIYLSKNILYRCISLCVRRAAVNAGVVTAVFALGRFLTLQINIQNYVKWILAACIVTGIAVILSCLANYLWYREEFQILYRKVIKNRMEKLRRKHTEG